MSFFIGRVSKSHIYPTTTHGIFTVFPLLVVRVVPGFGAIGNVMDLPQLVSACEAISVCIRPRWPFLVVFGRPGVVAGMIVGLVAAALH